MVQGEQLLAAQKIVTSVYYLQRKKSYYEPIYNKYVGGYIYNALSGQVSRYIVKSLKSSIWMFIYVLYVQSSVWLYLH